MWDSWEFVWLSSDLKNIKQQEVERNLSQCSIAGDANAPQPATLNRYCDIKPQLYPVCCLDFLYVAIYVD